MLHLHEPAVRLAREHDPAVVVLDLGLPGLDGVEVDHREHEAPERAALREIAERHDLLITGGSDFHGTGKPNQLGENLTAPRMLERVRERATSGTDLLLP